MQINTFLCKPYCYRLLCKLMFCANVKEVNEIMLLILFDNVKCH